MNYKSNAVQIVIDDTVIFQLKILNMYNIQYKFSKSISQFCDEINVGRTRFYSKMRELGILDDDNAPNEGYEKYFEEYSSPYSDRANRPSYAVTNEGRTFIIELLSKEDLASMKRSNNARSRPQLRYKLYRE